MLSPRPLFPPLSHKTGTTVGRRRPRRCAPIVTTLEDRALLSGAGNTPIDPLVAGPRHAIHLHHPQPAAIQSQASRTRVDFPGGFVNARPGRTFVTFPGGFVNSRPAAGRVRFPGGFVNARPGRTFVTFPGGFVNSGPGGTFIQYPGGSLDI